MVVAYDYGEDVPRWSSPFPFISREAGTITSMSPRYRHIPVARALLSTDGSIEAREPTEIGSSTLTPDRFPSTASLDHRRIAEGSSIAPTS